MAPAVRLATSTLRASLKAPSFVYRNTAFTAARCYSSKSQVQNIPPHHLQPDIIH
jgi:citrate synthase